MPRLTIGLPVYNGENYLSEALDALLAQSFTDFRLLVSDNASTDSTPQILARYASLDPRITVVRQSENIGGTKNFIYVLEAAETPLFMWAAHDDRFAPTFLASSIDILDNDPTAVLCTADIAFMHEAGVPTRIEANLDTAGMDRQTRVNALLRRFGWYAVYGVARTHALLATRPFTGHYGADVVQTLQLLLSGSIRSVPEPLIAYRIPATFARSAAEQYLVIDHTKAVADRPYTEMAEDLIIAVRQAGLSASEEDSIVDTVVRTIAFENPKFADQLGVENGFNPAADVLDTLRQLRRLDVRRSGARS
jgi:glycosyltransferase involved in cell wall biosynthesis